MLKHYEFESFLAMPTWLKYAQNKWNCLLLRYRWITGNNGDKLNSLEEVKSRPDGESEGIRILFYFNEK